MRPLRQHARLLRRRQLILLLLACDARSPAELYRDALRAETWEEGRAHCERLDGADEADCLVAVMEAQGRVDPSDCTALPAGVWRDECVFLYAERAARRGDLAAGLAACEEIGFGRECSFHLIREGARAVLRAPMAEAAKATEAYGGLTFAPDAERLFWKTWFRERLESKVAVDPTGCPTEACWTGARQTLLLTLNGAARARGAAFCDGTYPDGKSGERLLWVATPETEAWVREYVEGECARREGRRRGPAGPDGVAAPPEPGMGGMGVAPSRDAPAPPAPKGPPLGRGEAPR